MFVTVAIIRVTVLQVTFIVDTCVQLEWLWEVFLALSILKTSVTTAVNHTSLDSFEQLGCHRHSCLTQLLLNSFLLFC